MHTRRSFLHAATLLGGVACTGSSANKTRLRELRLSWETLPPIPAGANQHVQPGLASPFVGVHGDALIVGGGANFPEKAPWAGGAKVWWDDIFVLEGLSSAQPTWTEKRFRLPRPIGYGVSISTAEGVICAGGSDAGRCYADVFLLSWDSATRELRHSELPPLPQPLAYMAGAKVGTTFYVAGGQHTMKNAAPSAAFWALDLSRRGQADFRWQELTTWPGPARIVPVAVGHDRGATAPAFFLFGGRNPRTGATTQLLTDAYAFDPTSGRWRTLPAVGGGAGACVMAGTGATAGDEVLVFGGDRGDVFLELEEHDFAIEASRRASPGGSGNEAAIAARLAAKQRIYETHAGFSPEVLAYHPGRDTWRTVTRAPAPLPVTTLAVEHRNHIIIPTGEIRPGVRTPAVLRASLRGSDW